MASTFAGTKTSVTSYIGGPTPPVVTDWTNAQHQHDIANQGGLLTHSNLLGLPADDHTQYLLVSGSKLTA